MSMNLAREADWNSSSGGTWSSFTTCAGDAAPLADDVAVFNTYATTPSTSPPMPTPAASRSATIRSLQLGRPHSHLQRQRHRRKHRRWNAGGGWGSLVACGNSSIDVNNAAGYSNVLTVNSGSVSAGYDLTVGDHGTGKVTQSGGTISAGHILNIGADGGVGHALKNSD